MFFCKGAGVKSGSFCVFVFFLAYCEFVAEKENQYLWRRVDDLLFVHGHPKVSHDFFVWGFLKINEFIYALLKYSNFTHTILSLELPMTMVGGKRSPIRLYCLGMERDITYSGSNKTK
jgi:hypothetical protein